MCNVFIGIDPGADGFITAYSPDNVEYKFYQMPTEKDGDKQIFSYKGLIDLVVQIENDFPDASFVAAIEEVTGRNGWSATNSFNFGYTAGAQRMVLEMLGADIELVKPQKWMSFLYQNVEKVMMPSSTGKTLVHDTKATSAIVAQKLAPGVDFRKTTRSTKIHDGKTDSFLIMMYRFNRYKV